MIGRWAVQLGLLERSCPTWAGAIAVHVAQLKLSVSLRQRATGGAQLAGAVVGASAFHNS